MAELNDEKAAYNCSTCKSVVENEQEHLCAQIEMRLMEKLLKEKRANYNYKQQPMGMKPMAIQASKSYKERVYIQLSDDEELKDEKNIHYHKRYKKHRNQQQQHLSIDDEEEESS